MTARGNVLLINNRPPHTGIGEYTISLFAALKECDCSRAELVNWQGAWVERLYSVVKGRPILEPMEEALRVASNLMFMLRIPANYPLYHLTNGALALASWRLRPCVVTMHDLIPFSHPRDATDMLFRKSMAMATRAARIICVSEFTKRELLRFLPVDQGRVRVVHNGLDHDLFRPGDKVGARRKLGLPEDRFLVLHVGSEEPRKNIPVLLRAFRRFLETTPEALLVRVGEQTEGIRKLEGALGLENNLIRVRGVRDIASFYNAADLFVFPSYLEGFGLPVIEAMASGCPVVAAKAGSLPEISGGASLLVEPEDVAGFAAAMAQLAADPTRRERLIKQGLEQGGKFTWSRCAAETLKVYEEVAGTVFGSTQSGGAA